MWQVWGFVENEYHLTPHSTSKADNVKTESGSIAARVKHLIWDNDKNVFHKAKAEWLPNVPDTLEHAAVRIVNSRSGNRIYVRQYSDGTKHMVVVNPDGAVEEQRPFTGGLITQFPYLKKGLQEEMIIDWERNGIGNLQEGPNPSRTASTSLGSDRLVKKSESIVDQESDAVNEEDEGVTLQ
jgi:hypothetical protein